jgi:hypothetical protein
MNKVYLIAVMTCFAVAILIGIVALMKSCDATNVDPPQNASSLLPDETPIQKKKLDPYRLSDEPSELTLEGQNARIIALAVEAFKSEKRIPDAKKNLENYRMEMREDSEVYMISLLVKRDPKKDYVGGETENGVDVTYVIGKNDLKNITGIFYK